MKWAMIVGAILAGIAMMFDGEDKYFLATVIYVTGYAICREIEKTRIGGDHNAWRYHQGHGDAD